MRTILHRCLFAVCLVVVAVPVAKSDGKPAPGLAAHARDVAIDLDALLARHGLAGARVGFHAIDQENGGLVASRNADHRFIPASTAKLVTATAALGVLGPEHRFRTAVLATGPLRDGVLDGDLYLRGGGDPLLAVQDLMALVERLKDQGLGRVAGRFVYDASLLPAPRIIDASQPAAAPYNPGLSALSLDFNRVRVHWGPGADGGTRAHLTPAGETGRIAVDAAPGPPGRPFVPADGDDWTLHPDQLTTPAGATELPVRDPGRRTALAFRWLAQATGTRLPAPVPGTAPAEARELTAVDSLPLLRILPPALNYSNNMVSELVGLAAARKLGGRPETLAQSSRRLIDWLAAGVPGLDPNGLDLPNHSGLAAAARVTPRQMLTVVRHGLLMRYGADGVLPVLPAGGWRDALAGRFRDPDIAGRVWAKSGTLHYASGLVGVFFGQASGRRTIFALYVMDDAARDGYDADPNRETPAVQAAAEVWIDRAKAFEENLLGVWIAAY